MSSKFHVVLNGEEKIHNGDCEKNVEDCLTADLLQTLSKSE